MGNLFTLGGHNWLMAGIWQNSSGTGPQNVVTSAPVGLTVNHMWLQSTDTVDREVQLGIGPAGGAIRIVGSVTVPAGTGFGVLPAIDLLEKVMPGQGGLSLQATDAVQLNYPVAVTAGKFLTWLADGVQV